MVKENMFTRKENDKTIGVYEVKHLKICIHCGRDEIIDHGLEVLSSGHWAAYCLTKTGMLYMVENKKACKITRQNTKGIEDVEIFSDLLGEGDTRSQIQLNVSTRPVYVLEDTDIIFNIANPLRLCVSSKHLLVVTEADTSYTVHLLPSPIAATATFCTDTRIATLLKKTYTKGENKSRDRVLVKVVTSPGNNEDDSVFSGDLRVDVNLFKQLFGEDTALLNSPVVLVSIGVSIYYLPMSSFIPDVMKIAYSREVFQSDCWKLLCQMSNTVTDIVVLNLTSDNEECSLTPLCICGYDGQLIVFGNRIDNPECTVTELYINSPVQSVYAYRDKLYHSSLCHLNESSLEVCSLNNELSSNKQFKICQSRILTSKYVTQIHKAYSNGFTECQRSPCNILYTLCNGDLDLIETSVHSENHADSSNSSKDCLKNILISIDDVDKRRHELKAQRKQLQTIFQQLGIATYISTLQGLDKDNGIETLANKDKVELDKTGTTDAVVSVVVKPDISRDTKGDLTLLNLDITNIMAVNLSSDWTITASLTSNMDSTNVSSTSLNVGESWKGSDTIRLRLMVPFQEILTGCKLIVKASLVIDSHPLSNHPARHVDDTGCVSLTIYENNLDILDCLLLPGTTSATDVQTKRPVKCAQLQLLASSRTSGTKCHTDTGNSNCFTDFEDSWYISPLSVMPYDFQIHEENRTTKDMEVQSRNTLTVSYLTPTDAKTDKNNSTVVLLLECLFGKTLLDIGDINPSDFTMVTQIGHDVHFSVLPATQQCSGEHDDKVKKYEAFDIIVRSTPKIAAAVHLAINQREERIAPILGNHGNVKIHSRSARKAIETAQMTSTDIRSARNANDIIIPAFHNMRNINL